MSRTASELTNEEIELVEQLSDVANENYVYRDVNGDFIGVPWGGGGGSGDVNWPVSATANNFASFNGVTGKIIQDSGLNQASFAAALWADDNYVTDAQLAVINNTSGTNTGDQDLSSYATISYTDWLVVGLLDDRGSYNASSNLFPTTWGSGTAGAVMKWDLWTVSTGGTLWWVAVTTGDVFRALADTPWQTASNWTVTENNLWYVPENSVNKSTTLSADQASNTKFPSVKSVYDWAVWLFATISSLTSHTGNTSNPHSVTKAQVGLWNVDNTSDATKDSATATLVNKTINLTSNIFTGTKAQFDTAVSDGNICYDWDSVTNLTMSSARLLGRSTASTGAVEEITVGSGLTLVAGNLTATGWGTWDVVWPLTAVDNNIAVFDLTTGKVIKDWGVPIASLVLGNSSITWATKTKITYDAKGLVTAGADATTADIADSTNKRYVTDANLTTIGNQSGTNTGDNATNTQYSGLAASKEDVSNKATDFTVVNNTLYPTVQAAKDYTDTVAQGLTTKPSARLATTTTLPANTYSNGSSGVGATLTATSNGILTIDSGNVVLNDYILVKDQASQLQNGLYKCTTAGTAGVPYVLTRAVEMNTTLEFSGSYVFVFDGVINENAGFVCTNNTPPTVGTTAIVFVQFSGAGQVIAGNGLSKSANTLSINTAITADLTTSQTFTNKTLTSPTLVTPALWTPVSGNLSNATADWTDAVWFRNIPQNSKSAAYTLVLADSGKHIYHPSADTTARTRTIPANASVAYPIGTAITFVNDTSAWVITIAITTDTLVLAWAGTTGSRTLAANGVATAIKVTSTRRLISGVWLT